MPANLEKAHRQFDEGKYKQAIKTLWYAERDVRVDDDMEGAQNLLDLAEALHEVTTGSAQRDCDDLARNVRGFLDCVRDGDDVAPAPPREESRPSAWPLVLYGMVVAGAVALFLWAQQASSVSHALTLSLEGQQPTLLRQGDADMIEAVCIGLIIGCVVGFIIQVVRFSKATPATSSASPAPVAVSATPTAPQAVTTDQSSSADALRSLNALKDDGLVTDEEYVAKRAEILARI